MRALFILGLWDYKSAVQGHRNTVVLFIFALSVLVSGVLLWAIKFIAHACCVPTLLTGR